MEHFKEKLKAQTQNITISILIWSSICLLGFVFEAGDILTPIGENSHWSSMWHGFISGVACGFLVLMIVALIRNLRAMKDEKTLRKLFIAETDERNIKIWTSARATAMQTFLMLGLAAGIVAGYFNMTVSITILACVVVHSLIGLLCKIYYSKKF